MKRTWAQLGVLALAIAPRMASAQGVKPPATALLAVPVDQMPSAGSHQALAALILTVAATAVLLGIAKVNDFRRKREDQAVDLTVRISTALLEHPGFFRSSVGPTVHVPFWGGSPARITMTGEAGSPALAHTALRLATEAASRVRSDFTVENRMSVGSFPGYAMGERKGDASMAYRVVRALKTMTAFVGIMAGIALVKYAFVVEHLNIH